MKLEDNQFFLPFGPEARRSLAAAARRRVYRDGAVVFGEASAPGYVCLVESGRVQLFKTAAHEVTVALATVEPGDYFGEVGVIYRSGRIAGARALGRAVVDRIPADAFRDALAREPAEVLRRFSARVLDYLRAIDDRFASEMLRKEKVHLIGELANTIIHDFRSPLNSIHMAGAVLCEIHKDSDTLRFAEIIRRQTERMAGMAQELLDFARGHAALKRRPVAVAELFEDFRTLNEAYLKDARVHLALAPGNGIVDVDKDRFLRVLQNLVGNAVDAVGRRGGTVRLDSRKVGRDVEISVTDDGPGVPPAIRKTLFEPFVTYGKRDGTGLGLAIAKSLVEAHGGRISLAPRVSSGTSFRIRLPPPHAPVEPASAKPRGPAGPERNA